MTSTRFQFHLVAADKEGKTTTIFVRRVRLYNEDIWFSFPTEFQKFSHHQVLAAIPAIKSACLVIKNCGQFRNINVNMTNEDRMLYMDDVDNFVFEGHYLEQTIFVAQPSSSSMPSSDPKFDLLVSTITQKKDVKKMLKHLFILKLSKSIKNAQSWCDTWWYHWHLIILPVCLLVGSFKMMYTPNFIGGGHLVRFPQF